MKPNRYIKAMEIGLSHEEEGISYFDLVAELETKQGEPFIQSAYITFYYWFVENFTTTHSDLMKLDGLKRDIHLYFGYKSQKNLDKTRQEKLAGIEATLKVKWFLKGTASKQYIDYVEYKAARKSSVRATYLASFSILIAIASFYLTYQSSKETPRPPYDVKVIEDKSRAEQLERENGELRDELYKAEMMLEAYESDSTRSTK